MRHPGLDQRGDRPQPRQLPERRVVADGVIGDNPSLGEARPAAVGHRADPDPDGAPHRGHRPGRAVLRRRQAVEVADDARAQLKDDAGAVLDAAVTALEAVPDEHSGVLGSTRRSPRPRSRRPCARRSSTGWASSPSSPSVRCAPPSRGAGSRRRCSSRWRSWASRPRSPGCGRCARRSDDGARHRAIWVLRRPPGRIIPRFARRPAASRKRPTAYPMGYGVIGNTGDSGSSVLGSSPGTPALVLGLAAGGDSENSPPSVRFFSVARRLAR